MTPGERWREQLAAWALPDGFADRVPGGDPWALDVEPFVDRAMAARHPELGGDAAAGPAERVAREALGGGGTVLDIGCGAGAATVGLGSSVRHATGVDERTDMLRAYARVMDDCGLPHTEVRGRWPDVADEVAVADVVVAHHVVYNVPDLLGFLRAADDHARRRVVLDLTASHPRAVWREYWREVHGIERPDGPTSDDVLAVCDMLGLVTTAQDRWQVETATADRTTRLELLADRLCLREDELDALERADDRIGGYEGRRLVTIWWDTDPGATDPSPGGESRT